MNEMLQKHGCMNVFSIPAGLTELMSDISREVIRAQPTDLCRFIADYLSALIITREHGIISVKIANELCNCSPTTVEHLTEIGLPPLLAEQIAQVIMQSIQNLERNKPVKAKLKDHAQKLSHKDVIDFDIEDQISNEEIEDTFEDNDKAEKINEKNDEYIIVELNIVKKVLELCPMDEEVTWKVCLIARNAFKKYWYQRMNLEEELGLHPVDPWQIAAKHTIDIYAKTQPSYEELVRAARVIQTAYRGYHHRRKILQHLKFKQGPKKNLPGPPLDVCGEREMSLGPYVNIADVKNVFQSSESRIDLFPKPKDITYEKTMEERNEQLIKRMLEAKNKVSKPPEKPPSSEEKLPRVIESWKHCDRLESASSVKSVPPKEDSKSNVTKILSFSKIPEIIEDPKDNTSDEFDKNKNLKYTHRSVVEVDNSDDHVIVEDITGGVDTAIYKTDDE